MSQCRPTCKWDLPRTRSRAGWAVTPRAVALVGRPDVLIDLREKSERDRHGSIPGALTRPIRFRRKYRRRRHALRAGGHDRRACCSTAPSASARRWRCRTRRMPASTRVPHPWRYRRLEKAGGKLALKPGRLNARHPGGGGGRVPVSWEVRLVPFVDLRRTAGV